MIVLASSVFIIFLIVFFILPTTRFRINQEYTYTHGDFYDLTTYIFNSSDSIVYVKHTKGVKGSDVKSVKAVDYKQAKDIIKRIKSLGL